MHLCHPAIFRKVVLLSLSIVIPLSVSRTSLYAQVPPEVAALAKRTAEKVAKIHTQQILVSPLKGCLLNPQICEDLDAALRSALENALPGIQITGKTDALRFLNMHAFPATDVYFADVLQIAGAQTGSGLLIVEDLQWKEKAYDVKVEIFDVLKQLKLNESQISIVRHDQISDEDPLIYKDPESGVSLTIPRKQGSKKYIPECLSCPDPRYPDEAKAKRLEGLVVMLTTITEQGAPAQITVLKSFDNSVTQSALEAVRLWKFRPAVGPDGKPFVVRVPIEVTFRLR